MSNLERDPREAACGGTAVAELPVREALTGRDVVLGGPRGMKVTRTLPGRDLRMVGAWCFLDAYGPETAVMRVPPHPHTGLQTVSWLVRGEVLHRDSVGSEQLITPGRLNLMTAGRGIAHSEESPSGPPGVLHGVQLWVALPGEHRHVAPHFEHHPDLPVLAEPGVRATVIMGELGGVASPARVYSPLVGAEIALDPGTRTRLPLEASFEYAALTLEGTAEVEGARCRPARCCTSGAAGRAWSCGRARARGPRACCCSAASRSRSGSSCGGTSWAATMTRSWRSGSGGRPASGSARYAASTARPWPRPPCPPRPSSRAAGGADRATPAPGAPRARHRRGRICRLPACEFPETTPARPAAPCARCTPSSVPRGWSTPRPRRPRRPRRDRGTWVPYEDDPSRGKDRPLLVVGRSGPRLLGMMLSSRDRDRDPGRDRYHDEWLELGAGAWDRDGRVSYLRLDRVYEFDDDDIRREGPCSTPTASPGSRWP
ncbi:pirin family protein [Thermocatellispora tengchongensis]